MAGRCRKRWRALTSASASRIENLFSIVVGLQQGIRRHLSESLSNLANVLRGRKQLRLRLRAFFGRAHTAWVLGLLPFAIFGTLYLLAPDYVKPLFDSEVGHLILGLCW